jgi:hypothetical protein
MIFRIAQTIQLADCAGKEILLLYSLSTISLPLVGIPAPRNIASHRVLKGVFMMQRSKKRLALLWYKAQA